MEILFLVYKRRRLIQFRGLCTSIEERQTEKRREEKRREAMRAKIDRNRER